MEIAIAFNHMEFFDKILYTHWQEAGSQSSWYTVEPRYLELAYFELPLILKWKSGPCFNMKLWQ